MDALPEGFRQSYFWNFREECLSRSELKSRQEKNWQSCLLKLSQHPFYRKKLVGFKKTKNIFQYIQEIPFTTKQDLRQAYPYQLLQIPLEQVVETHASSGSTGHPTLMAYSKKDLELWADLMARSLTLSGIRPGHQLHNAYSYGLFTGGLGFHYGAQRIGALVHPVSGIEWVRQIQLIQELGSQVLLCTPSCALALAATAFKMGIQAHSLNIKQGIFGGESFSPELKNKIETLFGLKAWNTYGLSEVIGPGVAHDCSAGRGLHINEDHFYPEILDFTTGNILEEGVLGELVLSTITKEAMPVLRYRTGDRVRLDTSPCACGRSLARLTEIAGRYEDYFLHEGTFFHPYDLERILLRNKELGGNYQIWRAKNKGEKLTLKLELMPGLSPQDFELYFKPSKQELKDSLRVHGLKNFKIEWKHFGELPLNLGKARRLF